MVTYFPCHRPVWFRFLAKRMRKNLRRNTWDITNMDSDSTALPSTWVLWYHDPNSMDYSLESYIKIMDICTVADFWRIVDTISLEAWNSGMFFLMKTGYRPLWDAPENDKGGAWSPSPTGACSARP